MTYVGYWILFAHSVVERDDGSLLDITPTIRLDDHPFIRHVGPIEEFEIMMNAQRVEVPFDAT